mmetsp:Transcript_106618/g.318683  ORF Transcript_106618/g.318683 Transcript_106618/m.318683 type:complete len:214 (-) Transcript_106618:74-715(-)
MGAASAQGRRGDLPRHGGRPAHRGRECAVRGQVEQGLVPRRGHPGGPSHAALRRREARGRGRGPRRRPQQLPGADVPRAQSRLAGPWIPLPAALREGDPRRAAARSLLAVTPVGPSCESEAPAKMLAPVPHALPLLLVALHPRGLRCAGAQILLAGPSPMALSAVLREQGSCRRAVLVRHVRPLPQWTGKPPLAGPHPLTPPARPSSQRTGRA